MCLLQFGSVRQRRHASNLAAEARARFASSRRMGWQGFNERRALARKLAREAKAKPKPKTASKATGRVVASEGKAKKVDCRERPSRWKALNEKKADRRALLTDSLTTQVLPPLPKRVRLRGKQQGAWYNADHCAVLQWMQMQCDCAQDAPAVRAARLARFSQTVVGKHAQNIINAHQAAESSSSSSA